MHKVYLIMAFLVAGLAYGVVIYRHEIKNLLLNALINLVTGEDLNEDDAGLVQALELKGHRIKTEIKDLIQQIQIEEDEVEMEAQITRLNSLHNQWKAVKLRLQLLEVTPKQLETNKAKNEDETFIPDPKQEIPNDDDKFDILQSKEYLDVQKFLDEHTNQIKYQEAFDKSINEDNLQKSNSDSPHTEDQLMEDIENFFTKDDQGKTPDILQSKEYLEAKKFFNEKVNQEKDDKESEKEEEPNKNWDDIGECVKILSQSKVGRALVAALICATMAALSALATVKLITGTLALFGFTSAGIAGGSLAAFVQAKIGTIVAGSWFALMQSAGVVGLGFTGPVGIYSGLGVAGGCVAYYYYSNTGTYYDEFVTDLCQFSDKHDSVYFLIKSFA